jgi:hypothetical protein
MWQGYRIRIRCPESCEPAIRVNARKQIVQRLITGSFKLGACCPVGFSSVGP